MYCLLSDAEVQVNARFVYLHNVTCPVAEDGTGVEHCFQEAGTYFGQLAIRVQGGHTLRVVGGDLLQGFAQVTVDEHMPVAVGSSYTIMAGGQLTSSTQHASTTTSHPTAPSNTPIPLTPTSTTTSTADRAALQLRSLRGLLWGSEEQARLASHLALSPSLPSPTPSSLSAPLLSVRRLSSHRVQVRAGVYVLSVQAMDNYVDVAAVEVECWHCLTHTLQPQGLLGQTWNASAEVKSSDTEADEYREQGGDVLGCQHQHDKFCSRGS